MGVTQSAVHATTLLAVTDPDEVSGMLAPLSIPDATDHLWPEEGILEDSADV